MNYENDYPYWMALSHLPAWGIEKINRLIIEIIHNKNITFPEFFSLSEADYQNDFGLSDKQASDIVNLKQELANYAFLAENLLEQGFQFIPINSNNYSETLKKNLKLKESPPLLYVKGNAKLLNEDTVAIVGSRNASEIALQFTRNIAQLCAQKYQVVVSGFARGVDKMALDATLQVNGHSIVVLPQGILTFGSGIKKYYQQIIAGDVLILSVYHPNLPWSVGLAMSRNAYIYGLAKTVYVAEADVKGGTWNGAINGLKKGSQVFIRKPGVDEKNANNMLIMQGAIPVDMHGNPVAAHDKSMEEKLKAILARGPLTVQAIKEQLDMEIDAKELEKFLKNLDFIAAKKLSNRNHYYVKNSLPEQPDLFT